LIAIFYILYYIASVFFFILMESFMRSNKNFRLLMIATTISLILSLFVAAPAIADDATPPPAATEEPTVEPVQDIPTTLPEVLDQLPADTTVVVVVDQQAEPLVTQSAANIFVAGDPIWCPDGDAPTPGAGDCTATYLDLFSLIDDIDSGALVLPAEDGTIWIMGGNDNSSLISDISIDGSNPNFTIWNKSLTIQGGWSGISGSFFTSGTSVFSVPISVVNWGGAVTINQITIDGTNSIGLEIQTAGDVSLNDIFSNNNDDAGLSVDAIGDIDINNLTASSNGAGGAFGNGAELNSSTGSVTLIGINTFEDNLETGLFVDVGGDIDIENITASGNGAGGVSGNGAELSSSAGSVTLTGVNNIFEDNLETGLLVDSVGDIDLENITASGNGTGGASGSGAELNSSTGSVTLAGINNIFEDNLETGLLVDSVGDIDLENITASGNGTGGASGSGAELNSSTGSVTLVGISNIFEDNLETGLLVNSLGDIDLENVTASGNGSGGVFGSGAELNSLYSVSLAGTNIFNNNRDAGLFIDVVGDVDLENITANGNTTGAELNLSGSLSITGVNVFNNNDETGLYAEVIGDIDAENITANYNGLSSGFGNGVELYAAGYFYLIGTNILNGNHDTGLYVDAVGNIGAENVTASYNKASGAEFFTLGSFTLIGENVFNKNNLDGLFVDAVGNISIENVNASLNGGSGIYLETDSNASITCGLLRNNAGYEIEADLSGILTLSGVDFGGSIDDDLGVDEDQLVFISNGCFRYPHENDGRSKVVAPVLPPLPILPVNEVNAMDGQIVKLDCGLFQGTLITLLNGDGAYVPCQIVDSARLIKLPDVALPGKLTDEGSLVSSFNLTITKDGQVFKPIENPGSIWYVDSSTAIKDSGSQVLYWNGLEWIEITDQMYPFMSIFFAIPDAMKNTNLAILYWDGSNWTELSDNQYFGDGRMVQKGGHINKGGFFEASVNFMGTFALVQK
jgi:hypothetical protein